MLWEELSSTECKNHAEANGICLLPMGLIEKHGEHLPLGTDMHIVRSVTEKAASLEPAVVFPYYILGHGNDCKHYTGCIGATHELINAALLEMCDEIARNGFKKIMIVNSHGGNSLFLDFFAQMMAGLQRDYVLYSYRLGRMTEKRWDKVKQVTGDVDMGSHAGLFETSLMMHIRPDLVHINKQDPAPGEPQNNLKILNEPLIFTGLSWYGDFPYHYAGDHTKSSPEFGEMAHNLLVEDLCEAIVNIKKDTMTKAIFDEYNANVLKPL